jgi:alpha-mannosidase
MPLRQSVVILPCSSLEDLPTQIRGEKAAELLAAWTIAWHPLLVAQGGGLPLRRAAGTAIEDLQGRLVLLPGVSREAAPAGWVQQLEADLPGSVVTKLSSRRAAVPHLLEIANRNDAETFPGDSPLAIELAPDFFALGLAALVVEMLGHTMHYSSNLDKDSLEAATVAAAKAACEGNVELADEKLQRAFDLLGQARDYYYPVESYFLDVTLLAPSVWGQPLVDRLRGTVPTSVLLTASQAKAISASEPASLEALRVALADRKTTLIGGETEQRDQTQLSLEALLDELLTSRRTYEQLVGRSPTIFGRYRGGFSPLLPCLVDGLGFGAALVAAFDGSKLPKADHSRFRWEGSDGSTINALGLAPGDAGDAGSFLELANRLGHSMQHDHVATVLFASWPGRESEFYEDLWRAAKRCPTLGRFVTMDEYFDATHGSDLPAMFEADKFRAPAVEPSTAAESTGSQCEDGIKSAELDRRRLLRGLTDLVAPNKAPSGGSELPAADLLKRIAAAVCRNEGAITPDRARGLLAINLSERPRTICFADPAQDSHGVPPDRHAAEVPTMGFAWQPAGPQGSPPVPLASGLVLRNEYFQVHINPDTGGIGAVHDYRHRQNRLSQQLAVRWSRTSVANGVPDGGGAYTRMVAESVRVTAATPACGEITSTGLLGDSHGGEVARFQQVTRLVRGSRLIELAIELQPVGEGWTGTGEYAAVRWAWRDEPSELRRGIHGASFLTKGPRILATDFIEIVEDIGRLVLFTAEPCEHLYIQNHLDTVVPAALQGDRAVNFRVATAVDPDGAAGSVRSEWPLAPLVVQACGVPASERAWWFHCSTASVRWTALGPLTDGRRGFFARVQELTGRYVKARIESFRPIRSARKTNLLGEAKIELPVRDGHIDLQLAGYQWVQFEAEWD